MKLHEDKDAFKELIAVTVQTIVLSEVYIEKGYWIFTRLGSQYE